MVTPGPCFHTRWKINGWNLKITHEKKGKLSEPKNLHDDMCKKPFILRGVNGTPSCRSRCAPASEPPALSHSHHVSIDQASLDLFDADETFMFMKILKDCWWFFTSKPHLKNMRSHQSGNHGIPIFRVNNKKMCLKPPSSQRHVKDCLTKTHHWHGDYFFWHCRWAKPRLMGWKTSAKVHSIFFSGKIPSLKQTVRTWT